ncbi:MAG: Rpn family recombination-promoting nuclease/putative transposase [Lachnospiraceae bacterium]|nr:Rpn family recombination-promoting nuclease/putative transposase [Lachnospiraceae bacterium]
MENNKKFYGMSNDYMFRAVLQESEETLKHLVAALMKMDIADIISCRVLNPIILGEQIDEKETIMDVRLELNDHTWINIELQMWYRSNWPDRSLYYWARNFSNLKQGEGYELTKPTYHIGILDFPLVKDRPEFYAKYVIQNVRTGERYSDKLCIYVLDLTQIEKAEKEGTDSPELIRWAKIFKAKTMKELEDLAGDEEALKRMVSMVKQLSEDEKMQQRLEAREDYERTILTERNAGYRKGEEEGIKEGKIEGITETMLRVYQNCLDRGMSREEAIAISGITEDVLAKVAKDG